ncbi:hypothetical protein HNR44_000691 [Geomicrobium halophilum]|uniref:Uncharacterized protein n=1 Tax=Geomicrobium halophilum TaxID=549000 RepID=A0A841PXB6_9BACL|nr:hypothetical protein [Geomicrobium halophilum]
METYVSVIIYVLSVFEQETQTKEGHYAKG